VINFKNQKSGSNQRIGYLQCIRYVLIISTILSFQTHQKTPIYPNSQLQEIPINEVKINDQFWLPIIQKVQQVTLPSLFEIAEKQGKIDNFRIIAKRKKGKIKLYNAPDSDVYKLMEAAAYSLVHHWDSNLVARLDTLIDLIAAAQAPDGYLNTQYMLPFSDEASPDPSVKHAQTFGYGITDKWQSKHTDWPRGYSQLYCAGHLMEAAVAHFRATRNDKFLKIAVRFGDNIVQNFDKTKIENYGEHPQVELGLMKLYEATGNANYLKYADLFSRYVKFSRPVDLDKKANTQPLANQSQAIGHCVRTAYIYTGATDVARATGANDLKTALHSLWQDVVSSKMYIHGGTGNGTTAEQHGHAFDLPIVDTYSESCAAIAESQWNHSLNLLTGEAKYADIIEIETYNNALAGISQDGLGFFYSNKLNIDTVERKNQHSGVRKSYLFCCPSKVPSFITGFNRWLYAKSDNTLYINQFVGNELNTTIGNTPLSISLSTGLPFQGNTKIQFKNSVEKELTLMIRIPAWLRSATHLPASPYRFTHSKKANFSISINGKKIETPLLPSGYVALKRTWQMGNVVDIQFDMPIQRIKTDEKVAANRGRVALLRGGILYGLEGVDNDFDVLKFVLPTKNKIEWKETNIANQKAVILRGVGLVGKNKVVFKAIPYYLWQNRGIHAFATLLIEDPKKIIIEKSKADKKVNTNG
jgi:uncharacterized protein